MLLEVRQMTHNEFAERWLAYKNRVLRLKPLNVERLFWCEPIAVRLDVRRVGVIGVLLFVYSWQRVVEVVTIFRTALR